ncbi:MAG: methyltransferase domain-containing protein [Legionellales bacterium]|nr:methyltransferase domain-containing protein [Legionellales bacterium]
MLDNEAYSKMIELQTEMCFPFEYAFFLNQHLNQVKTILDFGCGNGYFMKKLKSFFPEPHYIGIDHNEAMINYAKKNNNDSKVTFKLGSVDNITEKFDIVILRLVLHQVTDRLAFLTNLISKVDHDIKVIIIDPLDTKFHMYPTSPKFMQRLKDLRAVLTPGNAKRNVYDYINNEMAKLNFKLSDSEDYYIPSLLTSYKEMYRDYLIATSNMLGFSEEITSEINNWYDNPASFFQMGLSMSSFIGNNDV